MELEEAKQILREVQKNVIYEEIGTKELEAIDIVLKELDKKDKVIDLMAEVLNNFDYDKQCENCRTDICTAVEDRAEYMKCIKEYFYKQVGNGV